VLLGAYPSGFSYPRPFRYRNGRIGPELLRDIKDPERRRTVEKTRAVLAMRFLRSDLQWTLVPIRRVTVTRVDYADDNHSVFFRLGDFFDFRSVDSLLDCGLTIPEEDQREAFPDSILFRSTHIPEASTVGEADEGEVWTKLCSLFCGA